MGCSTPAALPSTPVQYGVILGAAVILLSSASYTYRYSYSQGGVYWAPIAVLAGRIIEISSLACTLAILLAVLSFYETKDNPPLTPFCHACKLPDCTEAPPMLLTAQKLPEKSC